MGVARRSGYANDPLVWKIFEILTVKIRYTETKSLKLTVKIRDVGENYPSLFKTQMDSG
jgi:hypothetical protein